MRLPKEHPAITSYLGVPLFEANRAIGMIFLANKEGGYSQEDQSAIETLSTVFVQALQRLRSETRINQYAKELEKSNKELDDFAYIASHDLKEPLRGISSFTAFLKEDYGHKMDDDGKSKLDTLIRLCQQLDSFIDDLLKYSRVGRVDLSTQETDLNELVEEVIDRMNVNLIQSDYLHRIRL